ncbi:MAG TPA: exodeoxyribonuclease V subunit beta [Burkholderiales bacterium]|nr:exodeoxyribonuclease V subunit beta [Burkholderiales bacterium]
MKAARAKAAPASVDAATVALEGLNVVEANAGTGKTWTITALYLRLLLEQRCEVDRILVVTFTEAATGELRDRIRTRLADARTAFETGVAPDEYTETLLGRVDRAEALLRLTTALTGFDQAPIYTIHGFCQRVLADSAFESGMPFATEIVPDQSAFVREVVEDFWRNEAHAASALYTRFLVGNGVTPESLVEDVERYLGKPYLRVRAPQPPAAIDTLEREYERAWTAARALWLAERGAIEAKLLGNTGLNGNSYRQASIPAWLDEMRACLAPEAPRLELCGRFDKFTPESLAKGTKKDGRTPQHAFFDACGALKAAHAALLDAYARAIVLMKVRLLEFGNTELASRKARLELQSYDDLLLNLHKALHDPQTGDRLAAALRERYAAALIDEFQDTDPVQYDIFRRIYGGTDVPVFLVGDPKQSIYSFRGADVYAYLAARRDARDAHTLATNWRSDASLLDAVNRVFENASAPFVVEDIGFTRSSAAPGERGRLIVDGESGAPFEIWLMESADGKPINKGSANEAAAHATAGEIARLLALGADGKARIADAKGERGLRGGDIAVLARSHRQATMVRDALAALGVASVQRGSESVFATREAEELERVLAAIAEPGREVLIGAALATELMGYTGEAIYALRADEAQWEQTVESFRDAHRDWHELGFMRMLRGFAARYGVLQRLLAFVDGERRATNLLHIAELLHCDAERQGIAGLLAWFAAKRARPTQGNEAELLRLESDENLVKLLTVHASKGLEFPLVFCPFVWDGNLRNAKAEVLAFHDPAEGHAAVVDFGSDAFDASRGQAVQEERAESLRLLYVALTRAKHRCWIVWGNINDAEKSAPAWLLHRHAASAFTDDLPKLTDIRADLDRLAARAEGSIRVSPLPAAAATPPIASAAAAALTGPRQWTGTLRDTRRTTSFTALAHGRSIEAPDYDAADRDPLPESVSGRDIFTFPRGAQAGKCMHAIFEHADFAHLERPALERLVEKALAAHGFEAVWTRALADMIEAVVDTPLDASGMRLRDVTRERRLDELEFYYPLRAVTDSGLRAVLAAGGFPEEIRHRIDALTFDPAQGYMTGFIDIVFEHGGRYYLADYKSNWLGATVAAYGQPEVAGAMGREAYYLQYLVYCVALHRYLASRIQGYSYGTHFGGVRYLFVRGMRPASGAAYGVYADKPSKSLIEALDAYLCPEARR